MYIYFHPIKIQCLYHIVFTGGHYFYYEWCWSTVHSEGISESNMSTVAVIDGGMVLWCIYIIILFLFMAFHHHVGERISPSCSLTLHRDRKFSFCIYTFKPLVYLHEAAGLCRFSVWEHCHTGTVYSTAQSWQSHSAPCMSQFSSLETQFSVLKDVENQVSIFETNFFVFWVLIYNELVD